MRNNDSFGDQEEMNQPPQIRLTLDHMRQEIVHAFTTRSADLQKEIDTAVDEAIKTFNFKAAVEQMAAGILQDTIREALTRAIGCLRWDEALRTALVEHIVRELSKSK